ncbi:hypothetical protein L917_01720 [Phytophthora nicotianae]|uniref:Calponin-homology (CH) domain-containing protein n=1 Tax=Phytophthora nicotianae TaxID=4792 RepID=W2LW49_PHYNI|nr:hypothetical protein L917_01720 [Phytophthora nicotianae]
MPTSGIVGRPSTPCGLRGDRTASALQVAPSVVEFSAFERGSCYVATFSVRNASDRVLRFRLTPPPHASPFKVLLRGRDLARTENATVSLPPGLSNKYEVTFEVEGDEESEPEVATPAIVHDALQLKGDDGSSLEVPLMARRACPLLEVAPPLCELGLVVLTQRSARCVEVQNCGARPGRFVVEVLDASDNSRAAITVSPQRGKLTPLESVNVKVEVHGLETGDFRGIVRVRIWEFLDYEDNEHVNTSTPPSAEKIVDVSGSVVEHTAELVLRQGLEPVHSLFFGSLFAGETRTIETLLRNNGPQPLSFKTSISFGGVAGAVEEDREAYERRKELRISPADGCIDPFREALVTFIYHPRAKTLEEIQRIERKQGATNPEDRDCAGSSDTLDSSSPFTLLPAPAQPLTAFASIICEDLQAQNLTFEVSAKMFIPRLQLSPTPLDFGDVRSYDRADILLSLKNLSGLPVRFEVPKGVAHYSVNPRTGRLDVLQSQSLVVSFAPTQLGTFNSILTIKINDGVLELPVKVLGRAAVVGPVPPVSERLVGGPLALPPDFAPKYKFLLPEEAKQTKGKLFRRFQRQPPYELAALNGTAALDEFEFQGTNNTHLTYCVKELARRADHRAAYHDYLAQCRAQREAKAKGWKGKAQNLKKKVAQARGNNQEEDNEDVDLGMDRPQPQQLRQPKSLAKTNDPLWLSQHPTGGQSKVFFDELKLVKKKFKPAPATPAELADCARNLEFDELEQVVSGPKTLNFGRLSVNGSATRSLTVQNNLQHNVLVALHFGGGIDGASGSLEELARKTSLTSQVVPPHSKAGFDLVFCSSREQFFQQSLAYSINGVHPRQVTIVAEVAPIVVNLAPEDLRFDFGALDFSSSITREVVITNTCDSEAPFVWTRMPLLATPDGSTRPESSKSNATTTVTTMTMAERHSNANSTTLFEVLPASGTLGPSATLVCKVVYTPPSMTGATMAALGITHKSGALWLAQIFQLDVTGGEKTFLNCRALVPEVQVVAREKKVDFGTISVGVEREKKLTLSNLGMHTRAVFYACIEPQSMCTTIGLQVSPVQGIVDPQESTELTVKLFPHRAITLDGSKESQVNIIVTVRGGKVLRLPVSASVLVPDVFLTPADAIEFGEVVLGVSVPRVISLENHSSIPACLLLDLGSSFDEFALSTPPRLLAHLEDASNIFVPLTDDKFKVVEDDEGLSSDSRCSRWQICLPPHATVSCHLVFTPSKEGSHDLVLPLQIAGASMAQTSLKRRVSARAIVPRLRFSTSTIHFNRCIITREGIRKVPYTKQLVLTNDDEQTIRWQIDTTRLRQGNLIQFAAGAAAVVASGASSGAALAKRIASVNPSSSAMSVVFHVAPDRGELAPGEQVTIRVSFLPLDAVEYADDELPLFVDDEFYVNFSLRGEGIYPHLSFSTNRVVLPTVPLGMTANAQFHVYATGYDHLELNCRVPLDTSRAPLTVLFPRGKTLSMACPSLPVELRFSSTSSVAFNARVEFFDADGNSFALPVAGCAENCLFTNYSFLQTHGLAAELSEDFGGSPQRKASSKSDLESEIVSKSSLEFQFYTHASGHFPVYLLSTKQAQVEIEKAKENASASGFVVVDPPTDHEEDESNSTSSLLTQSTTNVPFSEGEIQLVMQYLNANFLRTPVVKFPEEFADNAGRPLYELLDMICIKKPGGPAIPSLGGGTTKKKTAEATNSGSKATVYSNSVAQASKKDQLTQLTTQFMELLRFLRSYGAMVHDVYPEQLLSQEFYLRACENPQVDPALLSSPSYASLPFVARRQVLKSEWKAVSSAAWMKVIYQVIKCFLLSRITWKGYQMQLQSDENSSGENTARSDKRKGEKHPNSAGRACQGSNVYSEAEMVLIQWLCDRVRALHKPQNAPVASLGGAILETQLLDIGRDLRDGRWFFHLIAAHIPTLSVDQSAYHCFRWMPEATSRQRRPPSGAQLQHQAVLLQQTLGAFGLDFGMDVDRFLRGFTGREILLLLLHLQQTLPQFIPKATIEFKGGLGQVMEKSIELKNPSAKPLRYHVFLDKGDRNVSTTGTDSTANEFTIESNEIVLDPGKTVAFVVTFRPRFSRKITARLVFQAVRGDIAGSSVGGGGATMVFLLQSNIVSRKPVRIIQLEAKTYEKRVEEILIENQFPTNANFKLSMTQSQSGTEPTGVANSGSSTGLLPSSRGNRRRSVQPGNQGGNSLSNFGEASGFGRRKSIIAGKNRAEDGDISWCIAAQQPFYLPEFGTSGSSNNEDGIEGGLSVPASGLNGASISIRKNGSAKVKLEFLPLVPGNYRCQLLFLDENIGEFLYEIHAVANLPASLETLEIQCEASTAASATGPGAGRFRFVRELTIPVKNPLLNRALTTFVERVSGHLRNKLKDGLKKCEETHHTNFHVEFNSPYFTANIPELTLTTGAGKPVPVSGRSDSSAIDSSGPKLPLKANQARLGSPRSVLAGTNSALINFQPKGAGRYACKLLLRSRNTVCGSTDVRVYDLVAKVREPNVKTQLEFVAPARHSIVQEIPLSNPTDTTWSLKAIFSSGKTDTSTTKPPVSMFSGPPTLMVPAKRSATYPLTFTPTWMYHETRTFVLLNTSTQQQFEFELSGYGEEPLAQDHVVLTCQARTSIVHNFNVFALPGGDANAAQMFKVESDLRDVVGAPTIAVPAGGLNRSVKYPLTFSPLVSGSYFGSVTFTNEATSEYIWYTVEASVSPPEPETTLEMRAPVRGAVGIEIGLANPLDSETTFTVELRGRGLLGPTTFTLEARQSGVYELVYSPLLVMKDAGEEGAILFSSDTVGQFWYRLILVAESADPQELDDMSCAVGDVCTQPLWLQNPSDQELQLQYRISNTRNFSIKGSNSTTNNTVKRVALPPFGRASVVVEYTPSSLSDFENTSIVFFEKDVVSDWEFTVRGRGRAPSVMKPLVVTARVNEAASTLFTFKNPFAAPLRVDVKLVAAESENSPPSPVFDMLLKKRHVLLESFGLLQVPISFIPRVVSETRAELVIHGGDEYAELEWRYPLRGVAEAPLHPRVLAVLACQARDSVEKRVDCELLAAPDDMVLANETFTVDWEIDAGRFGPMATAAAIERALTVTPLPVPSSSSSFILPYTIRFEPLRPYRGSIVLLVKKSSGGLWRFDVSLDAGDPPVDDVLSIESSLNQTSSVSFQLRNQFRQPAAFLAEFSAGSSSAFTVYPAEGELPPYGSEDGTMFVVSFTPTGYGKMQSGQLVICTEEMQWTFNVKGVYPDATPGSRASGPASSMSLSSSASRARLGITNGGSEHRKERGSRNRK